MIAAAEDRNNYICPISQQIFNKPVLASDGYLYEFETISLWFNNNDTSPMTNLKIPRFFIESNFFNSLLEEFLKNNPIEYRNRYVYKRAHIDFRNEIEKIIKEKNFDKLFEYQRFNFRYLHFLCDNLFECKDNDILKHVVDNMIDLECQMTRGIRFIHFVCRYGNLYLIQLLIDKGIDFECVTTTGWKPIHVICRYQIFDTIKHFLLKKNINLSSKISRYDNRKVNYSISNLIHLNDNLLTREKIELNALLRTL